MLDTCRDFIVKLILERFRITFTTNGRNDHVTMFNLYLPLAVFSFSVKLSSFTLAANVRIILHYSHPCTDFEEKLTANLTFAVCRKRDSKSSSIQFSRSLDLEVCKKVEQIMKHYVHLTNRFHFSVRLYSDNAQMTSKRDENKELIYCNSVRRARNLRRIVGQLQGTISCVIGLP